MNLCKLNELRGCGKCKLDIFSNDTLLAVSLVSIVKICCKLIVNNRVSNIYEQQPTVLKVFIKCNEQCIISTDNEQQTVPYNVMRYVYLSILTKWYKINDPNIKENSTQCLVTTLNEIANARSSNVINSKCIELTKVLIKADSSNHLCSTIVPSNQGRKCIFKVLDTNLLSKLTITCTLDILLSILFPFVDCDNDKRFYDIDETYLSCNKQVYSPKGFITCNSTFDSCRNFCFKYFNLWINTNPNKTNLINEIRNLILLISNTETIHQIYTICYKAL